jgi:DNA helicase HerA-like ATPase
VSAPTEAAALDRRLTVVPRLPKDLPPAEVPSACRRRMVPAVAMVHASDRILVCAWLRAEPNGRVAVLVGGVSAGPERAEGPIAFPAGARAAAVTVNQREAALNRFPHWERADVALDCTATEPTRSIGLQVEDIFALLPDRPMGFLLVARPRRREALATRLEGLSDRIAELETARTGRGFQRLDLARAEGELAYLEQSAPQGLWEVSVWTAGATAAEARAVAALVGGSADLAEVALQVRPALPLTPDAEGLRWAAGQVVGGDCVAALARPPQRELPGIRIVDVPEFDITPEVSGPLALGEILDATRIACLPFSVPLDSINRHVFVTGATGSGKSQTVRTLLTQLTAAGIPWMVIEPAKAEYARMAGRIAGQGEVLVIRPGVADIAPGSLNPLEPSSIRTLSGTKVFPLQTHLDFVRALFTASFQAEEPFPQILATALTRSYESLGWNLALGRPIDGNRSVLPRYPTLSDVQRQALVAVDAIGYGREVRDNVQGFVRVRIDSLRQGTPGRFFEGGHPLDVEALLQTNVVFEIEDLGDDRDKAFFIGNVLIRLFEVLRLREAHGLLPGGLSHVTVVEEAHRLLHRVEERSASAQAVTMFANLLAEVRAYGEGIVVAEQIPEKVIADVVKNSAVKFMHRLPAAADRELVGATMNLTPNQSVEVVALPPGVAAAHVDGMDSPVLVAVDNSGARIEARAAVPAAQPLGRRSPACPSTCASRPCTLQDMIESQAGLGDGRFALWAEVVTLGHLLQEPPRRIGIGLKAALDALPADRVRCALGLQVDAAIDRRSGSIRHFYDPARLKRQAVTVMRQQWQDDLDAPVPDTEWAVGTFRWADVLQGLAGAAGAANTSEPHPSSAAWASRGLRLKGGSWAEQLEEVRAASRPYARLDRIALLGDPPVIPELADLLGSGATAIDRLGQALRAAGLPTNWMPFRLKAYLEPTPPPPHERSN